METPKPEDRVEELFKALACWMSAADKIILNYTNHKEGCLIFQRLSCSCGYAQAVYDWRKAEAASKEIFVEFDLKTKNGG